MKFIVTYEAWAAPAATYRAVGTANPISGPTKAAVYAPSKELAIAAFYQERYAERPVAFGGVGWFYTVTSVRKAPVRRAS